MKRFCLALFGGKGERFGSAEPKQFTLLDGEPMLLVTLKAYEGLPCVDGILVVAESSSLEKTRSLIKEASLTKVLDVVPGGKTRQESSFLGLQALLSLKAGVHDLVLIVDGDRPCISGDLVERCYAKAEEVGAAVTAIPSSDSVLLGEEGMVSSYVPREAVYLVQTPQCFHFGEILWAHAQLKNERFTDDASLLVSMGKSVAIVTGERDNVKITTPCDVAAYLRWKSGK